jgi:hypothetical protein
MPDYVTVAEKKINLSADRLSTNASFDAVLSKPLSTLEYMYKLTIKLRFRLQPSFYFPVVQDFNGTPFWVRPWTGPEWLTFINGAKAQANMWNNRFWLKPPPHFGNWDVAHEFSGNAARSVFRPYVACVLEVDFNASKADAHRTIDVYNLDLTKITGVKDSGTFRSDAVHYDSLDNTPYATPYRDSAGNPIMHYTIAHEIGHAIGQPHIGVMRKTPLCEMAMNLSDMGFNDEGQNSAACYGGDQPSLGRNVMGGGSAFSADNAKSWQWAMLFLRGDPTEYWQVLTSRPSTEGEIIPAHLR